VNSGVVKQIRTNQLKFAQQWNGMDVEMIGRPGIYA